MLIDRKRRLQLENVPNITENHFAPRVIIAGQDGRREKINAFQYNIVYLKWISIFRLSATHLVVTATEHYSYILRAAHEHTVDNFSKKTNHSATSNRKPTCGVSIYLFNVYVFPTHPTVSMYAAHSNHTYQ